MGNQCCVEDKGGHEIVVIKNYSMEEVIQTKRAEAVEAPKKDIGQCCLDDRSSQCCSEDSPNQEFVDVKVYSPEEKEELRIAEEKKREEEAERKAAEERYNKLAEEAAGRQIAWKKKEAEKKRKGEEKAKREEEKAKRKEDEANRSTCKFTIILKRNDRSAKWGFTTMYSPDDHQVLAIREPVGASIEEWHEAHPTKLVRFGDEIITCNGKSGDARTFFLEMSTCNELEIVLRRKLEIEVTARSPLGVRFKGKDGTEIVDIRGGGIMDYNERCSPKLAIGPGDVLQKVDGKQEGVREQIEQASAGSTLKLVFTRPPVN